ncbi:hypothetical protein CXQ81_13025 [Pseudomonas sp. 09C 129]|nr:hypothetical protein CXQ81_13025 [Pseudomonas sp. 09C 129]
MCTCNGALASPMCMRKASKAFDAPNLAPVKETQTQLGVMYMRGMLLSWQKSRSREGAALQEHAGPFPMRGI